MKKSTTLGGYSETLLSTIDKSTILLDLSHSIDELSTTTVQLYGIAIGLKYNNDRLSTVTKQLRNGLPGNGENVIQRIGDLAETIIGHSEAIFKLINDSFNDTNPKAVLDYRHLNLIKYVELVGFWGTYANRFVVGLASVENGGTAPLDREILKFIAGSENIKTFLSASEILVGPVSDYYAAIKHLEGHLVDPTIADALKTTNGRRLDPHGVGFLPVAWSPVYHVGLAVNAWRANKLKRNKEVVSKLQLTVMALTQQDDAGSERIARQIAYHNNRISLLSSKISDEEEG